MLKNITKKTIISETVNKNAGFIDKTLGMITNKNYEGLIFETMFGIHTFFMKSKIDVMVLDKDNAVRRIKKGLKPYKFYFWNPKFSTVIELPEGTISQSKTEIGDKLDF